MLNTFYFHDNGYKIWTAKQFGYAETRDCSNHIVHND